jgi:hypothetical protein
MSCVCSGKQMTNLKCKLICAVFSIALQNTVGDLRNEIELLRKNTLGTIRRIIQGDIAVSINQQLFILSCFRDEKRCKSNGRKCSFL